MIQLRADDPLIYDITESGEPVILQVQQALGGFQIDFELPLAIGGSEDAGIIDNHGLEEVYPIVKMYGALHNPKIINQTTNQSMQIDADLGFAEGSYFDPVSTEDSTLLNFNSPYNAPLDKLDIKGNTTQQTYTGKNLFNKDGTFQQGYIGNDGTIVNSAESVTLVDYIPAEAGVTYVFSYNVRVAGTQWRGISYYDSNKTFISRAGAQGLLYFTPPAGTAYIRVYFYNADGMTVAQFPNYITNIQLEKGSTATAYEPYVGGVPAPSPSYPQPVQTVVGENVVQICGKNLLDSSSFINAYYDDSGTMHTNANANALFNNYIFVQPSTSYTYSSSHSNRNMAVSYFTSSFTFISRDIARNGNKLTFTTPNNCVCIRLQANYDDSTTMNESVVQSMNLQLELGSTDTSFEAYQGQSYEVNLGKNLLNYTTIQQTTKNGVTLTLDDDGTITLDGTCGTNNTTFDITPTTAPMYLSGTYTISYTVVSGTISNTTTATKVQLMNNSWGAGIDVRLSNTSSSGTWTRSDTYNRNNIRIDSGVICDNYKIKIQLELGSTATTYAPYFTPIELCKIGNYQDYIYKSGSKWYLHKAINEVVFDGSNDEDWQMASGTCFTAYVNDFATSGNIPYSPYYPGNTNVASAGACPNEGIAFIDTTIHNRFYVRDTARFASPESIKTWLASNPMSVYYALRTPTDTVITNASLIEQLEALASSAKAYAPVTNIGTQIATGNALPILNATYYTDKDPDVRDEVIIDSRLKTITLNGLDIYHLKTPGSEFLMLAPGQNKLILQSDNTSDNGYAEVNYKQGYLSI